jgi:hypothetical protein
MGMNKAESSLPEFSPQPRNSFQVSGKTGSCSKKKNLNATSGKRFALIFNDIANITLPAA